MAHKKLGAIIELAAVEGMPGTFRIVIADGEGGTVDEPMIQRRGVEAKVDAYSGRPEPHLKKALIMWAGVLARFPKPGAGAEELQTFADRVGLKVAPTLRDASRLWEAIFAETGIREMYGQGGEEVGTAPAPNLPEDERTRILTGLPDEKTETETAGDA